ncbi:HTH-type transcriptional activator RhaS [BD1-7 clade bacterium]|uniref:HTH-type transcriptional activator RhaS n=1 Tax=BD1-7 clade bacterium TaxID=2029982 RepID=A0A5S9NN24_9GAMM|nr:HTH-type transcriptional activator RhaS [BD1-7 clade bacterium]
MASLGELMQQYAEHAGFTELEGLAPTAIDGLSFYRSSTGNERQPFVYQSGIIILGQGQKKIHIGDTSVTYGPDDYLVVGVPMPLECEAQVGNDDCLMGLNVKIDASTLHHMVSQLEDMGFCAGNACADQPRGLRSVAMASSMLNTCKRLLETLCDPFSTEILGQSLLDELIFRALRSEHGHVLFALAHHEGHYARVAKALAKVHHDYASPLTVNVLAEEANMSVSSFHDAFRAVTLESPLQYVKKVRLNKARDLIHAQGHRVSEAARQVGYNSASQFSREYKRHFNETPKGARLEAAP